MSDKLTKADRKKLIQQATKPTTGSKWDGFTQKNETVPEDNPQEIVCNKCGSNNLAANKKGISLGKAVVGGILAGPAGIAAGALGSDKVIITCLSCGHQWKPGDKH